MAQNEKIRTEDVVEVLDSKIITLSGHPALGVMARENYDSVLTKISAQVLSPDQKLAFDNTLTLPTASNPVVLKDDLAVYVPTADLGNVRDSVNTYVQLPPAPVNFYGDLRAVIQDGIIYRWSGTTFTFTSTAVNTTTSTFTYASHGLTIGQAVTLETAGTLPAPLTMNTFYYVVAADLNTFQLSDTLGGLVVSLTTSGTGTMRVLTNGSWSPFIQTGTIDHTQLVNQNGSPAYQHLTQAEKDELLTDAHAHANKSVLDSILSAGSGQIITVSERSRLPTPDQKSALTGTSGSPSLSNPYVTNNDPRLNTVRNPYVTIGPPGTLASFQGIDFRPFSDALHAIDNGTASAVKAIEVLPGFYTLGGVSIEWSTQGSAIVIEAWTPNSATLSFQTFQAGIQSLDYPFTGKGPLIVRGFTFELNDTATFGILSQRAYTLIENCTFRPGPTTAPNQGGVILQGDNTIVRRCRFEGSLAYGIKIRAQGCRVEECTFNLSDHSAIAVSVPQEFLFSNVNTTTGTITFIGHGLSVNQPVTFWSTGTLPTGLTAGQTYYVIAASTQSFQVSTTLGGSVVIPSTLGTGSHYCMRASHTSIDHCNILSGTLSIAAGVAYTGVYNNFFAPSTAISDNGVSTRYIENLPEEINQPYVGGMRTVGHLGSYADYRGATEAPIVAALADPRCTEVILLEGDYAIGSTISVPQGKMVRGVTTIGNVSLTATSGITPLSLASETSLRSLSISGANVPLITFTGGSSSKVVIEDCQLDLAAVVGANDYEIYAPSPTDLTVSRCFFNGVRGLRLSSSMRSYIKDCMFNNSSIALTSNSSCTNDHINGNIFMTSTPVDVRGSLPIITSNHFLSTTVPTKVFTTGAIWSGNYPHPTANNDDGSDWLVLSTDRYIEPIAAGCIRQEIDGFGVISYPETITSSAGTIPMALTANLDQASIPSRNYLVDLWWTAQDGATGSVKWRVTITFRDKLGRKIGTSTTKTGTSIRTGLTSQKEDTIEFVGDGGYGLGGNAPTHVSVIVERVGEDSSDTMIGNAYLTEVQLTLPRD